MMSLWNISRNVAEFLGSRKETGILDILKPYPLEQRRFIVAIQHQESSLLFHAVNNRLILVVVYFLQNCGADPNSGGLIEGENFTCLAAAILANSPILVEILLYYEANAEIVFTSDEITALYYACLNDRFKIAKILIRKRANLNSRDALGRTCLMSAMGNLNIFKMLVAAGADINLTDRFGVTCLLLALSNKKRSFVSFLLSLKDTQVRLSTDVGTDALYTAVEFSSRNVMKQVIQKGSYTIEEIAVVNEMLCCQKHILNFPDKAHRHWQKALRLRGTPRRTRMFETSRQAGKIMEVIHFFDSENVRPLRFIESMSGFSLFTAYIYTIATWNLIDADSYLILCEFFFDQIKSMDDSTYFRIFFHGIKLLGRFAMYDYLTKSHGLKMLQLLVNCTEQIKTRLQRMAPEERSVHGCKINHLISIIIHCFNLIFWHFPEHIHWFSNPIKRLISLDIRGPCQKSLLQRCAIEYKHLIESPIFLPYQANVNSSDRLGKTVLHDLLETANISLNRTNLIIDHGFDFRAVKYDGYCLPCRLKTMDLLRTPLKYMTLQCLAAEAFCKNAMTSFNEVPRHLMPIVKSHLHNFNFNV